MVLWYFVPPFKKLADTDRINFLGNLKANQRLSPIWETLTQEKQLSLSNNSKLCDLLSYSSPILRPPVQDSWAYTLGSRGSWMDCIHSEFSWFDPSVGSLEDPLKRLVFILPVEINSVLKSLGGICGGKPHLYTNVFSHCCLRQWATVETDNN
jgi:hypothetical protein